MTPEQKAAFIMAQAACANAEIAGMRAENQMREALGDAPAYGYEHFSAVMERYGIHHNAVVTFFGD